MSLAFVFLRSCHSNINLHWILNWQMDMNKDTLRNIL